MISDKFLNYLTKDNNKIFFDLLSKYTTKKLKTFSKNLFELKFTSDVILFFDSIPSYSKILEQRKRRIKNYLESQNRKQYYIKYFTDLENCNIIENDLENDLENDIEYDYFGWMNKKFSCNKIIDSNLYVKHLKDYITDKLKLNNINIKIDEEHFGEADYKIFKYISSKNLNGKITILSCDSDLVYQLILQQHNYDYTNSNINLGLFKFYVNSFDYCQYFDSNKIINYINNSYNDVNNLKDNINNNFCLDFLLLLNFFGNDFLPSSLEIGPEIGFNYLLKTYDKVFHNSSLKIINPIIKNDKLFYKINFYKLRDWLKEISKCCSLTKILLLRYYRVPFNITQILTDKMGLNLKEIRDKILKPYLIYNGMIKKEILDDNDIRLITYKEFIKTNSEDKIINPLNCLNYPSSFKNFLEQLDSMLYDYLDYTDIDNLGFKNNSYNIEYNDNMYENLYNYISFESYLDNFKTDIDFDFCLKNSNKNITRDF